MLLRLESGAPSNAAQPLEVPAEEYTSEALHQAELERIFRRLPLLAAARAELPVAGRYKTITLAGVPLLLVRGRDDVCRAFVNACTHRASPLKHGCGQASRFTCPYHGWTFNDKGALIGITSKESFGAVNARELGLRELPLVERSGLLWVSLDPQSTLDIDRFLAGFDGFLGGFNLAAWHFHHRAELPGANWKLAFDAHLEFYHLPVLHRETFGVKISNQTQYYFYGPHQRLGIMSTNPSNPQDAAFLGLKTKAETDWDLATLLFGEWIVFPNVSINCFAGECRVVVISQVLPGRCYNQSTTIQTYLVEEPLADKPHPRVAEIVELIQQVVREEDLPMSHAQQRNLDSGALRSVWLGANEAGVQHHYHWRKKVMAATDDAALDTLFSARSAAGT